MTERITTIGELDQLPVTLEEVKAHLRVTTDTEDSLHRVNLLAALQWATEQTNRAIALRTYLVLRDRFPISVWPLPLGRIQSIQSVQYIDADGVTQTWSASPLPYETDLATDHQPRLRPRSTESWPTTGDFFGAARISLTAGWTQAQIPNTVRQAILLKCAALDESRAPGDESPEDIERAAVLLLGGWMRPVWSRGD